MAEKFALHGGRQPMNEGSQEVRFDQELPSWRLNPNGTPHAPRLAGEGSLPIERPEMLDDAIRENDIEAFVWIRKGAAVTHHKLESVSEPFGQPGNNMRIEQGDPGLTFHIQPEPRIAAHIQNGRACRWAKLLQENLQPARPETLAQSSVE